MMFKILIQNNPFKNQTTLTKIEEKICGYEMKSILQYVLIKQLQVLYGNRLFKYPKGKNGIVSETASNKQTV